MTLTPIPVSFLDSEGPVSGDLPFIVQVDPSTPGLAAINAYDAADAAYQAALTASTGANAVYNAAYAQWQTQFGGQTLETATSTFLAATSTYITALITYYTAQGAYILAGSPGSGTAYDTWVAAESALGTAYTTWSTAYITFADAVSTFVNGGPYTSQYLALGLALSSAADGAFLNATNAFVAATEINYAFYATWIGAGSPGSGTAYDNWQTAQANQTTAANTWGAAVNSLWVAIYTTVPPGNAYSAWIAAGVAYDSAYDAYSAAVDTYNAASGTIATFQQTLAAAIAFAIANPTQANPYSTINPV